MSTAFYSIIQFCPDAARQEAVNVGVVLFDTKTKHVGIKFAPTADRVRKFFGTGVIDSDQLKHLGESVHLLFKRQPGVISSPEEFRVLVEPQANELRFTLPRRVASGHPQTLLESLYQRLVEKSHTREKRVGVEKKLRQKFHRPEFDRLIRRAITVEVESVPVRIPFGYQNGRFHLIQPATFQTDSSELIRQTAFLQVVGEHVRDEKHPLLGELGLVVVGELLGKRMKEAEQYIRRDLERVQARFYSAAELDTLFHDILAHAKPADAPAQRELDGAESN